MPTKGQSAGKFHLIVFVVQKYRIIYNYLACFVNVLTPKTFHILLVKINCQ